MPGRIFIYFRSADSEVAHALFRKLADRFSERQTFLMPGEQGGGPLSDKLGDLRMTPLDMVVVVIGPGWLPAAVGGFRMELASAMATQTQIIPVLVSGAEIPPAEQLPEELRSARRYAVRLRPERFDADCQAVIEWLEVREAARGREARPVLSVPAPVRSPSGNPLLAVAELQSQHAQRRRVAAYDELAPAEWLHHDISEATLRSPPAAKPAAVVASQVERPQASPSITAPPARARTSGLNLLNRRIQAFQLYTGVG